MRRLAPAFTLLLSVGALLTLSGCGTAYGDASRISPIVGTWLVSDPNAPFPYHLYVFNGDGTLQQANPDAGDPRTSDSDGKGMWRADGEQVVGKWVELSADRATHQFLGRLEITFRITVTGDSLTASERVTVFDSAGRSMPAPATPKPLKGTRITLP